MGRRRTEDGTTLNRRPASVRSRAFTLKSALPAHVKTTLHYLVIPYGLGLVTLIMRVVYSAIGIRDLRIAGLTATQDYVFGFSSDLPDPSVPGQIALGHSTSFDPGPLIDEEFCGPRWYIIIAAALGTLVILLLLDNALVWLNRSCWYHPKRHLVSEVDFIRRTFKAVVILTVLSHGALQAFAMGILFDLQRHQLGCGCVFVALFLFFDRLTFFVNVEWDREDEMRLEDGGVDDLEKSLVMMGGRGLMRLLCRL
ncbi:hypothetical protein BC829DRAFT_396161 [Chytridium lagenaria]|nr:hypothetical protein BC829DRAFT_396161 [Chytridium lagenaria]